MYQFLKIIPPLLVLSACAPQLSTQRPATAMAATLEISKSLVLQHPENADLHYNLGVLFDGLGDTDSAMACYRAALLRNPALEDAFYNLAFDFYAAGDFDSAFRYFCLADSIKTGMDDSRQNISLSCLAMVKQKTDRGDFNGAESAIVLISQKNLGGTYPEAEARWLAGSGMVQAAQVSAASAEPFLLLKRASRQLNACADLKTERSIQALSLLSTAYDQMAVLVTDSTPLLLLQSRRDLYHHALEAFILSFHIDHLIHGTMNTPPAGIMRGKIDKAVNAAGDLIQYFAAAPFPPEVRSDLLSQYLYRFQTLGAGRLVLMETETFLKEKSVGLIPPMEIDAALSALKTLFRNTVADGEVELMAEISGSPEGSVAWLDLSDLHIEWMGFRKSTWVPYGGDLANATRLEKGFSSLIKQEQLLIHQLEIEILGF